MTDENNKAVLGQSLRDGGPCGAEDALARRIADEVVRIIEDKWGGAFARLEEGAKLIRSAALAAKRNTAIILSALDGTAAAAGIESCTLRGTKRRQFLRLCELKKADASVPLHQCARTAVAEIVGDDGYDAESAPSLVAYAALHRSWWRPVASVVDAVAKGGAE